jgi:RNA polymerase sigma-70 factor (ECF subfamily)
MSRVEDKSNKEIAKKFGISVKGVDYHVAKALKVLRVTLKDYLPALLFLLY